MGVAGLKVEFKADGCCGCCAPKTNPDDGAAGGNIPPLACGAAGGNVGFLAAVVVACALNSKMFVGTDGAAAGPDVCGWENMLRDAGAGTLVWPPAKLNCIPVDAGANGSLGKDGAEVATVAGAVVWEPKSIVGGLGAIAPAKIPLGAGAVVKGPPGACAADTPKGPVETGTFNAPKGPVGAGAVFVDGGAVVVLKKSIGALLIAPNGTGIEGAVILGGAVLNIPPVAVDVVAMGPDGKRFTGGAAGAPPNTPPVLAGFESGKKLTGPGAFSTGFDRIAPRSNTGASF